MARIERKAYYVGTWREDVVSDTTMRHIIARSLAEKGQKVKVKLSPEGLRVIKTVLLQENFLSSFPLKDVYFLTVNQRHPTCLLCIVADPVRKYLILAMRTANEVEAQEIISTFKALKDNPALNAGNVVLKRKDNGNWTLRERSQHNANRHLVEIFSDDPKNEPVSGLQPNGHAGSYAPGEDGREANQGLRYKFRNGFGGDYGPDENEVEDLSKDLQDVKFVVEKTGTVSSATIKSTSGQRHYPDNNNTIFTNNNTTDKSHYIETEILDVDDGVVIVHSDGDDRMGEARVAVDDHRQDADGVVRAHSNGSVLVANGRVQHKITVPEPNPTPTPTPTTTTTTADGADDMPAYTVYRRVSTEYVTVPNVSRKPSATGSLRSGYRVSFDPEAVRRTQDRRQYHSLRTPRGYSSSGVPSTIVRPIEQIYGHVTHARPSILKRQPAVLVAPQAVAVTPQQQQHGPASVVYAVPVRRRSRPSSIHIMEGNELKVFTKSGEADDLLL